MPKERIQYLFFFGLLLLVLVLSFYIFSPFISSIVLAATLAVVLEPVFESSLRVVKYRSLAAILTIVFLLVIVALPITFLGKEVLRQSQDVYSGLANGGYHTLLSEKILQPLDRILPGTVESVIPSVEEITQTFASHLGQFFSGTLQTLLTLVLSFLALFFFLKDGSHFRKRLISLSPLDDAYDILILERLKRAINSVVRGSLTIALVQGILAGIGMTIFGIPHAALWGSLTAIAALVPSIGTSLVLIPAILFLFLTGATGQGVGLLAWSIIIVGLIDNALNPYLVGRGTNVHPFLILLAVLGGITYFGPIGFILGPIVLSLLYALLDIYEMNFEDHA